MALQQALLQLAMQTLTKKDYMPLYTPFFMNKSVMKEVSYFHGIIRVFNWKRNGNNFNRNKLLALIFNIVVPLSCSMT